jgi:polyisoprenoid-binding protein YceI
LERSPPLLILAGLLMSVSPPLIAQGSGPIPDARVRSGTLSFDGHASVGDFVGTTATVSGQLRGGADLTQVRGWVQAPVKTLKTGNGRRDKDLNKSMESDKYPDIRFELTGITPKAGNADSLPVMLQGKLLIHGTTKAVSVPATLQLRGAEARVRSEFPLSLKSYNIGGLSKMLGVLKMYDNIEVHVDVLFAAAQKSSSDSAATK